MAIHEVQGPGLPRFARNDESKTPGLPRFARNDESKTHGLPRFARNDGVRFKVRVRYLAGYGGLAMTSQRRNDGHHFVIARSVATRQSMKTMFFHFKRKISPATLFGLEQFAPIRDVCVWRMKSKNRSDQFNARVGSSKLRMKNLSHNLNPGCTQPQPKSVV